MLAELEALEERRCDRGFEYTDARSERSLGSRRCSICGSAEYRSEEGFSSVSEEEV